MLKSISLQNLIENTMQHYEHFHLKTLTGKNDARQTLATVLHTRVAGQY